MRQRSRIAGLVLAAVCSAPVPAVAQSLDEVDALARAGRTVAARTELLAWFDTRAADASRADAQRALWLRAILTLDPRQAELDLTRLALEYPGGPFSEGALVRLAGAAVAAGDPASAERHYRRLERDYPSTQGAATARAWLATVGAQAQPTPAQAQPAPAEAQPPRGEVSTASAQASPPRSTSASGEAAPAPRASSPAPRESSAVAGGFTVQVGAFANDTRARTLEGTLLEAGFEARRVTVPGSDLVRVRVGRFATRAEAETLLARLVRAGHEGRVAEDASRESPAG